MLGKIEGKRRKEWQRIRWLDSITDPIHKNLRKFSVKFSSVSQFSSVAKSCLTLRPHKLQHARIPVHHTPGVHPNLCPSSWGCHPNILFSVVFSSCPQSFPASGSFPMSHLFASGGQIIEVSASVSALPMNTQTDLL